MFHVEQYGHQFDQPIRKLESCLLHLNSAAVAIDSLNEPGLKRIIDEAINSAGSAIIAEEDRYNERD